MRLDLVTEGTGCPGLRKKVGNQHKIHQFFTTKSTVRAIVPESKPVDGHWSCPLCTFENTDEKKACEMCGSKRRKRESEGDVPIDRFFGGKRKVLSIPLCSGHHLRCVRHQGSSF